MTPTVGRIVHYYTGNAREALAGPFAALVVEENGARPSLHVFAKTGTGSDYCVNGTPYSEEPKAFHWTWPPKV